MSKFKGNKLELKLAESSLWVDITALKMYWHWNITVNMWLPGQSQTGLSRKFYFNIDINLKFWNKQVNNDAPNNNNKVLWHLSFCLHLPKVKHVERLERIHKFNTWGNQSFKSLISFSVSCVRSRTALSITSHCSFHQCIVLIYVEFLSTSMI